MIFESHRQILKEEIESTADAVGNLTAERVVTKARNPTTKLHGEFEWRDDIAAHQHRLDTARRLIREVTYERIVLNGISREITWIRDPDAEPRVQAYSPLEAMMKDRKRARAAMAVELARIRSWAARAERVGIRLGFNHLDFRRLNAEITRLETAVSTLPRSPPPRPPKTVTRRRARAAATAPEIRVQ